MINYNLGKGEFENWVITEEKFSVLLQGKCEAIFCLGNGYMGMRSATEEKYPYQTRNTFVAGTFNKFDANEVTELPNVADALEIEIFIDNEPFSLQLGQVIAYSRTLNLKTGEVSRNIIWKNTTGKVFTINSKRFVSQDNLHLFCSSVTISCTNDVADIKIVSGINGQMSNSGAQHFHEGEKRIFEGKIIQMTSKTTESKINFVHHSAHKTFLNNKEIDVDQHFGMDRRKVFITYNLHLQKGIEFKFDKINSIHTSRDIEFIRKTKEEIVAISFEDFARSWKLGYEVLFEKNVQNWLSFWQNQDIKVVSKNEIEQLAIRFAIYHLKVMTPSHDARMGIGAKGLSGEGYKGHSFWDTELFMLPYFTFSQPEKARKLLEYRYHTLAGARKKAKENGFKGAMYPWESAWMDDGEVTPVWGAADIITGEATKIWSGFIEQHITSDVSFGVWQYFKITNDIDFMEKYGYEILLDTGIFWGSRFQWNEDKQRYHIENVIGPDEYKEHINNDAFTNHTAFWCVENAIFFYNDLKESKPDVFKILNQKLNLDEEIEILKEKLVKLYIPEPNQELVIPQDDTYLLLDDIDLTKYKNQKHVGSLFMDYSLSQVNKMQVSKQASVVMLMYLLEHKFSKEIKTANFNYYEPRTLHDSSLSLSTHAIVAADMGELEMSYKLFQKAIEIDLGPNMKSSDHGIHGASIGGIWQIMINGFAGLRLMDGVLRIEPKLPETIAEMSFNIFWKGERIQCQIKKNIALLQKSGTAKMEIMQNGKIISFTDKLEIRF